MHQATIWSRKRPNPKRNTPSHTSQHFSSFPVIVIFQIRVRVSFCNQEEKRRGRRYSPACWFPLSISKLVVSWQQPLDVVNVWCRAERYAPNSMPSQWGKCEEWTLLLPPCDSMPPLETEAMPRYGQRHRPLALMMDSSTFTILCRGVDPKYCQDKVIVNKI